MAKLDAFNFKWTPFSEMDFKICGDDRAPLDRAPLDVCNLCRQSLDDENHVTVCCNAPCHEWCDEQCHNYLCKCPLCKSATVVGMAMSKYFWIMILIVLLQRRRAFSAKCTTLYKKKTIVFAYQDLVI